MLIVLGTPGLIAVTALALICPRRSFILGVHPADEKSVGIPGDLREHEEMSTIADVYPVLGLRIRSGSLELRGLTDDDLVTLGTLAQHGVHDPEYMPFVNAWTDQPAERIPLEMAQYHWELRSSFRKDHWNLELGVWHEEVLVGCQGMYAKSFHVIRSAETGSWLGRGHHGKGIGTAMRQAICAFAFDHLGAIEITSGAFADNASSIGVSRKVGYLDNGRDRQQRREEGAEHLRFRLTPETFVRGEPIDVQGADAVRRVMGLDD